MQGRKTLLEPIILLNSNFIPMNWLCYQDDSSIDKELCSFRRYYLFGDKNDVDFFNKWKKSASSEEKRFIANAKRGFVFYNYISLNKSTLSINIDKVTILLLNENELNNYIEFISMSLLINHVKNGNASDIEKGFIKYL